jgi:hypothetical protein
MTTWPTDTVVTNRTILYAGQQYSTMVFGANASNKVPITVPKASYYSAPFYLKNISSVCLWCQVYLVNDGNGTLGLVNGALKDVNINITVTGNGAGGYSTSIVRYGGSAPAGSCLLSMPLNMSVWTGTTSGPTALLLKMPFTMVETTGFISVRINDTHPWQPPPPPTTPVNSMNGYRKNSTGLPFNNATGVAVLAGAGAGLDIYGYIPGIGTTGAAYTDYIFTDHGVMATVVVGGIWVPVDKLALLAPYIGLVSAIVLAVATTAVFFKHRKKT